MAFRLATSQSCATRKGISTGRTHAVSARVARIRVEAVAAKKENTFAAAAQYSVAIAAAGMLMVSLPAHHADEPSCVTFGVV